MNKLSKEEKDIEKNAGSFIPLTETKRKRVESIIAQAKKNRAISLRISEFDLEKLKQKAENDGIPYQTLINTVLHKYVTNQLLDKSEVFKSIQVLKSKEI